jgi:hypothetical protein
VDPAALSKPLKAYLTATTEKPLLCFFELETSAPLLLGEVQFTTEAPEWRMSILGTPTNYIHPGMPVTVQLRNTQAGSSGELFLLSEQQYRANGNTCVKPYEEPLVGLAEEAEVDWPLGVVEKTASLGKRMVSMLPEGDSLYTHFVWFDEFETESLSIGQGFFLCYVGDAAEMPQIYNPIFPMIRVKDVVTGMSEDRRFASTPAETNSLRVNLLVESTLTGTLQCLLTTVPLSRTPTQSEVDGTYNVQDTVLNPNSVLARTPGGVTASIANTNTSVVMAIDQDKVANIVRLPLGTAPRAHAWCNHKKSTVVFPDDPQGFIVEFGVLAPPTMVFMDSNGFEVRNISFVQNVSFGPLELRFPTMDGFPRYYFDEVSVSVSPPLPDGLRLDGYELVPSPRPVQTIDVLQDAEGNVVPYRALASSLYDISKGTFATLTLAVYEAIRCDLANVKTTEIVVKCDVHNAANFHATGVYLNIMETTAVPSMDPASFACTDPSLTGSLWRERDDLSQSRFTCTGAAAGVCCCYAPFESIDDMFDWQMFTASSKHNDCNIEEHNKRIVQSMVEGYRPDIGDTAAGRVQWVSDTVLEFTRQPREEAAPVVFDMELDMDYEVCETDPDFCEQQIKEELSALLGIPVEEIEISALRES